VALVAIVQASNGLLDGLKLVYCLLHPLDCSASLVSLLIAGRVIAGRSVYVEIMPNKHPAMTNKQTLNT